MGIVGVYTTLKDCVHKACYFVDTYYLGMYIYMHVMRTDIDP